MLKSQATMTVTKAAEKTRSKVPGYCSYRWAISFVGFLGFIFVYAFRINLSLAIVCMVKVTNTSAGAGNWSEMEVINGGLIEYSNSSETCVAEMETKATPNRGEFDWNKQLQSRLLAAFFYGYIVTPIPGGWLARKIGCRKVLGVGMFLCILSTVLVPLCARINVNLVFFLRIVAGLTSGVSFPAMHCLWGRWAPPLERSKLMALCYSGSSLGNILTLAFSGLLCANGFDNGWGSIFYVFGAASLIWLLLWIYLVYDTPRDHPRISEIERDYIEGAIGDNAAISDRRRRTPWLAMLKSPALWACVTAHFCNNWTNYTLLTSLPTYMKEVLKFDIKQNGFLSAVPYVCQFISSVVSGQVADFLREQKILTTRSTRRVMQVTAFVGAAVFLVATGFVQCENRMLAVVFLSLAVTFKGLERGGYMANHVDFGPRFAGELYGITNTVATIPGMVTPLVSGALTPNKTQEEWRLVFFLCAGVAMLGALVFGTLVRGEVQEWALLTKPTDTEIQLNAKDSEPMTNGHDSCKNKNNFA